MSDNVLTRTLAHADLEIRGDGRTVYGMAMPFDQESDVDDGFGRYREVFRFGAFAKTIRESADRVKFYMNHAHRERKNPIGRASKLAEDRAGLVGEFRVSSTRDGDEALELIRDGVLDSFSAGFEPVPAKTRQKGDLVERLEVKLREVSIVAFPAYQGALIAGLRDSLPDDLTDLGWTLDELVDLARSHDLRTLLAEAAPGTSVSEAATTDHEAATSTSGSHDALRYELTEYLVGAGLLP